MLRRTSALFSLSCLITNAFAANAPITAVVLYPGSATIERTAQVSAGMTQLEITGLPANFDTQTIRVQADAGIQVGQVTTRDAARTESASAREAELEAKIQVLEDKVALLDVDARSAALVQKYLENLNSAGTASDRQQPVVDARSMAAMLDAIQRGGSDAFTRMHKAEVQKREIAKQVEALQRDLARLRSGARDGRQVTVQLAARQAGALRLTYQVNNAGWKPTYRAMLNSSASTVELERLATVSQKTGEDWSSVKLKLSTGQPRQSPQAVEPRPWLLTYQKPVAVQLERAERPAFASAPAPAPAPVAATSAMAGQADNFIPPVIETRGSFATEFDVPSRVTLPADGREISVALSAQVVPVKQRLRTSPRIEKAAVVTAEAARPDGVWLPGSIQLFRDGSYVGAAQWNTQRNDKFTFAFGRDDLIRVSVDRVKEQSGTTGVLTQQNERVLADVYTITSFHKKPVDLLVLEASPVSTSEEVKVQASFNVPPTLDTWERRRGVVGWESVIAPNQTLKYSVDYAITYPKEGFVRGLP
ncbi:mucoidy inhibitor MuiA family protein [Noviherbaspirillum sp.]|uniref:mucoidy inhibitor MuiA family protein n=1 Tax=Noviherbaspirillum sp. TaxID=1926288 RepID=UPI002FE05B99